MPVESEWRLTQREVQIFALVAEGRSAKEIALTLRIAPSTVERHIENLRLKTRTRNRAHMVAVITGQVMSHQETNTALNHEDEAPLDWLLSKRFAP